MPIRFISVATCRRPIVKPSASSRSRSIRLPANGIVQMQFIHPPHDGQIGSLRPAAADSRRCPG